MLDGVSKEYYQNGSLKAEWIYENKKFKSAKLFRKNGKLEKTINNTGDVSYYN